MAFYRCEDRRESLPKFLHSRKVPVVGSRDSRVVPQTFGGVEFGGIRGQLVNRQPLAMVVEPRPNILVLVVGGVVLHEVDLGGARGSVDPRQAFQEPQVGGRIEHRVPAVVEARGKHVHRPKDLNALARPRHGDQGLRPDPRPGLVEGGVLAEAGFVFEDERSPLAAGFFLMLG